MTQRFGIDTSILVRLVTGDPEDGFARCVEALTGLVDREGAEVYASNQVIGEAYVAIQHHYGVPNAHSTRFDHRFQRDLSADSRMIRPAIPRSCDRGSRSAATPGLHCYAAVVGSVNGRARRLRNDSPWRVMR